MPPNCFRAQYGQVPMFAMERSATCMFGLRQYGVDVNGYIKDENGQISIWMQKRSTTKPTWPGRWDNFVSLLYNFAKLCLISVFLLIRYLEASPVDMVSEKP